MKETTIPFMEQTTYTNKLILVYSAIFCLLLLVKGLNYGIDFTGGHIIRLGFLEKKVADSELREALLDKKIGFPSAEVFVVQDVESIDQLKGYQSEKLIHLPVITPEVRDAIFGVLKEKFGKIAAPDEEIAIGPAIGDDMKRVAFLSIVGSIFCILIYMSFRFERQAALGAVIALVHDTLFTLGVLSIIQLNISLVVVAAILTVLGYSLNDSIVILDRIRENQKIYRKLSFYDLVNFSLNQTLWRTILTSITTLIPLLCLFFFGGESLKPFTATLLIGICAGTFSSIYVVSAFIVFRESQSENPKLAPVLG